MPNRSTRAFTNELASLFDGGTCAGKTDGELLEQFRSGRGEGSERAFEAMVDRHGPMVLSICRGFLEDSADMHDAFQAVFLVLARRAVAIRKGESVGSWLYGVSVRVAARARAAAIRRRIHERRALATAEAVASGRTTEDGDPGPAGHAEHRESAAAVHEEMVRLPEKYRAPILLCYLEGLTHDEAAARLNWPVGTVRSRLARARDRLRGRLERRGVTAPAIIGAMAAWLDAGPGASSAATVTALPQIRLSVSLGHAAVRLAAGEAASSGSWPAASIALADGVLNAMLYKKLTIAAGLIATLGIGTAAGISLVRGTRAQEAPAARAAQARPAAAPQPTTPDIDPKLKELIEAAREQVALAGDLYRNARMETDSYLDAIHALSQVELLAARTEAERSAAFQGLIEVLRQAEQIAKARHDSGRGTTAGVAASRAARLRVEYDWTVGQKEQTEKANLLRRIAELERKVGELEKARAGNPRG